MITVVIVTLAVAFLMMMLSTSYIDRQVGRDVRGRTAGRRMLEEWVDKVTVPMTPSVLVARLAVLPPQSPGWKEMLGWGKLTEEEIAAVQNVCREQQAYERWLAGLEPGERSALVGTRTGDAVFAYLAEPGHLDKFVEKASSAGKLPKGRATLERLIQDFVTTVPLRERILDGHAAAVAGLSKELGATPALKLLSAGSESFPLLRRHGFIPEPSAFEVLEEEAVLALDAEQIVDLLDNKRMRGVIARRVGVDVPNLVPAHVLKVASGVRGAGWLKEEIEAARKRTANDVEKLQASLIQPLTLSADRVVEVGAYRTGKPQSPPSQLAPQEKAALDQDAERLSALLRADRMVRTVARHLGVDPGRVRAEPHLIFQVAATPDGARLLIDESQISREETQRKIRDQQNSMVNPLQLPVERIAKVAAGQRDSNRLAEIEASLPEEGGGQWLGFSSRTAWLIIISFVVCVVGVANAMLMSVTERFREIATMKCLGALDSFIMIMFVMESALQGLTGGLVGIVLGFLLGLMRSLWGFGTLALVNLPGVSLLASAGACLAAGVLLAAMAAVYPAWVAARLAPMEAMRIE